MNDGVIKAYRINILKVYALVYSLVALPMAYYGFNYIELIYKHMTVTLPLLGSVMVLSVIGAIVVQAKTNKRIKLFLSGNEAGISDKPGLKRDASYYPIRLVGVMVFGWIILVNLMVLLPAYFLFRATLSDLITCNLLVLSCGLMSVPMTYFISEKTVSSFLSLDSVKVIPNPEGIVRITLTTKILSVCLIIIVTLILNTTAATILSFTCSLSSGATIANLAVISVLGVIDAIVISFLFARSLKLPIANLCAGTELVKSGDLSTAIPCLSNDELGDSSSYFNVFVEKLGSIIQDIKLSVKNTRENVGDLQQAMDDANLSVEDIHRFSANVQSSIINQATIVTEVTTTIQQIASTIGNQDKRINDQSRSLIESSSAIEEMIANIQSISGNLKNSAKEFESLQTAISAGNKNVDELKTNVLVLSKQSDSVYEANSIIKNIAAQTNLLAMNAAIEAAHAGESGRGFAVVADEIRKLAEVSNQQSKLISESLKVLKQTIEAAVRMTANTGTSFNAIISSVQTVNGLELEIKNAIDEQSSGGTQILRALSGMNEITAEVHDGSSEMMTGSNTILSKITSLIEITVQVKNDALNVVEKARTVQKNTGKSMLLLARNTENMKQIDDMVSFFVVNDTIIEL